AGFGAVAGTGGFGGGSAFATGVGAGTDTGGAAGAGAEVGRAVGTERANIGFTGTSTAIGSVIRDLLLEDRPLACHCFGQARGLSSVHTRTATRSFALRARGLVATSVSAASTGFFVTARHAAPRNACFTRRSSSEWKLITP